MAEEINILIKTQQQTHVFTCMQGLLSLFLHWIQANLTVTLRY